MQGDFIIGTIFILIVVLGIVVLLFVLFRRIIFAVLDSLELAYAYFTKRPFFVHFYLFFRRLSPIQLNILANNFEFYNRLGPMRKRYFRHRLACFIKDKEFVGKSGFIITDEVKVLIGATAVMLTFGFRKYKIKALKHIIVYPTKYYSKTNKAYHKGEFNVNLGALVLSWDNFLSGYKIDNDNINLGIHEFAHAIHHNSIKQNDINSILFVDTFNEIRNRIKLDKQFKQELKDSKYFRDYAFSNDAELLAVIIETFIETPKDFKLHFPIIYSQVKQMLNFNFSEY